jgi:CBS-domain-containing membrane protein
MTRDPVVIAPEASVMQAVQRMLQHRIGGLPVIDASGALVGILTESDLLRRTELGTVRRGNPRWLEFLIGSGKLADEHVQSCSRKISEIMTVEVFTASEEASVADVVDVMEKHDVRRVPILQGKTVIGIVSRSDLVRALARSLKNLVPAVDDSTVRLRLQAELDRQNWAPASLINIVVLNGVVQLWGVITDEAQRHTIRATAERTPGAKVVEDHLMLVQPTAFAALMS